MMTPDQLRQSFLDFFIQKQHSFVPSASLLPEAPNLLFTNAGMNQFIPFFLGEKLSPWKPARAVNSQKCIRAGGKHNDLEDVGLDTYHHTFFEMLGNWSFGDYFKKEMIPWAWELLVERWGFPPERLYATVYQPAASDPASFDQESYDLWQKLFLKVGLDPQVHIVMGNRHDNFWMMGETGPCGPCSEIHIDLTAQGDTKGSLVNQGSPDCLEIWNLVFIEFSANIDGSFDPLPQRHVDTGMGLERLCSIIEGTDHFRNFTQAKNVNDHNDNPARHRLVISNYETALFRPIFDALERLSFSKYQGSLPRYDTSGNLIPLSLQERQDVAFRVIADHLRTLSFAIADGILPGNSDRHYVLRRILRRALGYGRALGLQKAFLYELVPILIQMMKAAFPELGDQQEHVIAVIKREEEAFNRTIDHGLVLFEKEAHQQAEGNKEISGEVAFRLYDEQGFPLDLTQLLARARGLSVDLLGFEQRMEAQRQRARSAQKKEIIAVTHLKTNKPTRFLGWEQKELEVSLEEVIELPHKKGEKKKSSNKQKKESHTPSLKRYALIFKDSICYAEMGGQVGDQALFSTNQGEWPILDTQKQGAVWLHIIEGEKIPSCPLSGRLILDVPRRQAIARHHTATHLLHAILRQVMGPEVTQKGSFVGPQKLTFDITAPPISAAQLIEIEKKVNELILQNSEIFVSVRPYLEIRDRKDISQFFSDQYGEEVRIIQIGGEKEQLNGFSMELCGGTHVARTGELGFFKVVNESAVAAGVRRIEAVAGLAAWQRVETENAWLKKVADQFKAPFEELSHKVDLVLLEKENLQKKVTQLQTIIAEQNVAELLTKVTLVGSVPTIVEELEKSTLDEVALTLKLLQERFDGMILLGTPQGQRASLMAFVGANWREQVSAGEWIKTAVAFIQGKGGGNTQTAQGAGPYKEGLETALAQAKLFLEKAFVG